MRSGIVLFAVLVAVEVGAADDAPKASAILDGKKLRFPEAGVAAGVKATTALLESSRDKSDGTVAELTKAQQGDHVRLVFPKPVAVMVLGENLAVAELVLTQPLNTGVFWLRVGDKVVRCTKYRFEKEQDFLAWRKEATVAD
jgi:hypothetical protein